MARLRRLDRRGHRLAVAHLADHDAVGVLAHGGAQGVMVVGHVNSDLALRDDRLFGFEHELDRILDRHDVHAVKLVDPLDHGGERRALARTGHPTDQDEPGKATGDRSVIYVRQMQLLEGGDLLLNTVVTSTAVLMIWTG